MTQTNLNGFENWKENKLLKRLLSKGIRRQIKRRIVKKEISLGKEIVRSYIFQGLKAEVISSGITKHQYYQKKKTKQGRVCSINTFYTDSYGQKRKFQ
jgi:hypothetical protein